MTSIGIDEIINKLSSRFNKIFYDREFVGCVCEDLQTVIKNKNTCCVLVFPALSPNYLRVVRYQAKLFDLAVIPLGSGGSRSVGVCQKKYFLQSTAESEENSMSKDTCAKPMAESVTGSTRKKRPPIQLYVPPAQRKSKLCEKRAIQKENTPEENNLKSGTSLDIKSKISQGGTTDRKDIHDSNDENAVTESSCFRNLEIRAVQNDEIRSKDLLKDTCRLQVEKRDVQSENGAKDICLCTDDVEYFLSNKHFTFPFFSNKCNCVKFFGLKGIRPNTRLLVFSIKRKKPSFYCNGWHLKTDNILIKDDKYLDDLSVINIQRHLFRNVRKHMRVGVFGPKILDFRETKLFSQKFTQFENTYYLCGNNILFILPNYCCYLPVPQYEVLDELLHQDYLQCCTNSENDLVYLEEFIQFLTKCIILPPETETEDLYSLLDIPSRTESPQMPCERDKAHCDNNSNNICDKTKIINEVTSSTDENKLPKKVDRVIVLDEYIEKTKTGTKSPLSIKNKDKGKDNEHEQEKEIMRKAKQNINRKTRPIIKYVDDDNDTLRIGKGDNVNNWEDLFNDEGEIEEEIFSEIIQKVGPEVTIVKATEDYSAYVSKQVEELEHMVELYDFPASFETHDIISAFSELNSDSMYIKWVDDTRALLVLGSSMQAKKAIELSSPIIKVRPMSVASNLALEKAYQSDLKPAMKRPQTNLQTARRLITSHLGAKSRVTKEQHAKEREDLRVAKERRRQAKQNEKDAWEGNIRSAID